MTPITHERDPRVPYHKLDHAAELAAMAFPHAEEIHPIWTPIHDTHDVHVEVYERDEFTGERKGFVCAYTEPVA